MNELKIFEHKAFGAIRTMEEEDGKMLFCGTDVAKSLGYDQPSKAVSRHCPHGTKCTIGVETGKKADGSPAIQEIEMTFVPEGDVYRLIARSKLPTAEQFERWVFDEVLPTIRKTGGYVNNEDQFIDIYFGHLDEGQKSTIRASFAALREANEKIERDKPKVIFADAVGESKTSILVGELAKLIRQNGVEVGQGRLYAWLRENGYLIKRKGTDYNMPTQKSMEANLFRIKEHTITTSTGVRITKTPLVTGKGQIFFVNKFLSENKYSCSSTKRMEPGASTTKM